MHTTLPVIEDSLQDGRTGSVPRDQPTVRPDGRMLQSRPQPCRDLTIGTDLRIRRALPGAWKRGEMRLDYQPIHETQAHGIAGVEALLRWRHPVVGDVPPAMFIGIAERSGLIEELGAFVLQTACAEILRCPSSVEADNDLFVSINVSPFQLKGGGLPRVVEQCLQGTGLAASRLHLELTESAAMPDELWVAGQLDDVRNLGVKVWLDDFGMGFSRLNHLRCLPVDGIKIDRSFVAALKRGSHDLMLTAAIISMAHTLEIPVIAEGVETQAQFDLLRRYRCEMVQGNWLGRPMDIQALKRLLREPQPGCDSRLVTKKPASVAGFSRVTPCFSL